MDPKTEEVKRIEELVVQVERMLRLEEEYDRRMAQMMADIDKAGLLMAEAIDKL